LIRQRLRSASLRKGARRTTHAMGWRRGR